MSKPKPVPAVTECGKINQPFYATCQKCGQRIFFDIDPSGTPGLNGDWGDRNGDYGCEVDNGDDSEDGNGHVPTGIIYDRSIILR